MFNKIDPYGWFQWYFRYWLAGRSKDDKLDSLKIETKFDAELMAKLEKSNSNSEYNTLLIRFCLCLYF